MKYIYFYIYLVAWWSFTGLLLWIGIHYLWNPPERLESLNLSYIECIYISVIVYICSSTMSIDDFKEKP